MHHQSVLSRCLASVCRLTALTVSMCGISDASMLAVAHLTRLQVRVLPVGGILPSQAVQRSQLSACARPASTEPQEATVLSM
jgi:hypothetical protein